MSSTVTLKAAGLQTSSNQLDRVEGALIEANNVIIKRDGIIEQRRGYKLYGEALPSSSQRVKQLTTYRERIIRHYASALQYDSDGAGNFLNFAGVIQETQTGLRMKFVESNGNFYMTTSDGIKKISARTSSDFATTTDFINPAGAIKAVDLSGVEKYTPNSQSAFLPQDGAVAYRVVWAYNDINNNLLQGTPSQREIVGNPMETLLIRDYTRGLDVLDNLTNSPVSSARINDKDYVSVLGLNLTSTASDLYTNLIALCAKLDNDIYLADNAAVTPLQITSSAISSGVCTITMSSGNPSLYLSAGKKIFLAGFSPATGTINGAQTILNVTATTITFNTTATGAVTLSTPTIKYNEYRSIAQPSAPSSPATNDEMVDLQTYYVLMLTLLAAEPTTIISATDIINVQALDITTTSTAELRITIPDGVTSNYFYQIYRSAVSQATGANIYADVTPNDELQLVYEAYPTAAELAAKEIVVEDVTPDAFRGANLYTNASTGEGILQSNDIPPFAKDINRYRNSVFYANTRTKQRLNLSLLGVTNMITEFDANGTIPKVTISNGTLTNTYNFVTGVQEQSTLTAVADVADSLNSKYFLVNSVENAYYVYYETTTATDPAIPNRTGIKVDITTGDSATVVAERTRNKLGVYLDDFVISGTGTSVIITNIDFGVTPDTTAGNSGFGVAINSQGRGERVQPQITQVTAVAGNLYTNAGASDYFTFNTVLDNQRYYVWFQRGASTDPAVSGRFGIQVTLTGVETAPQVVTAIKTAIDDENLEFTIGVVSNVLTITNSQYGEVTAATESVVDAGFTVSTTQEGALEVLLSPLVSPARAVDETSRSLIRAINKNPQEIIYAYYLSSAFDVPGQMFFESRSLTDAGQFYILSNNDITGMSFNPDIGPDGYITNIATGLTSVITTSTAHGLRTEDQVMISSSDSVASVDGLHSVTVLSSTTFSIPVRVVTGGTTGSFISATNAAYSENEEKSNRVYYSKFQQPEAVPITNYFDVGAQDKAILRIVPLRDSLFVFKEDGLYRISGDSAPFQLSLFDSSFNVLAPDSVSVANNVIYAWTTQGIQSLTEGGAYVISRPIDNIILKTQSDNYTNFKTATWATGYESDNSYIVFTVLNTSDTSAQIGYRYSTLTQTWTTYDLSPTCGVINSTDDRMYLGTSDVAYIEQERKAFDRTDYADREYEVVIGANKVSGARIVIPSVTDIEIGDVFTQVQTLTAYQFNTMLDKLDSDTGVADSNYNTLALVAGEAPRSKLLALAVKMDDDTGINYTAFESSIETKDGTIGAAVPVDTLATITSTAHGLITGRMVLFDSTDTEPLLTGPYQVTVINANTFTVPVRITTQGTAVGNWQTVDGDFQDIKTCYNYTMGILNTDTGVSFNNYSLVNNTTLQESIVSSINRITRTITVNNALTYLAGAATVYKAIESVVTYSPNTMGDPLGLKHLREATLMLETKNITNATLSFKSDLLPQFIEVPFTMQGNGIFGHNTFGSGFFGGIASSAPFRTYIPRQCQRCRFIIAKFTHKVAREDYRINGLTITGEIGQSTRAYR